MTYLEILTYYLIIGFVTALTVEFVVSRVDKYLIEIDAESEMMPWGNRERTVTILVWPYTMVIFIIAFGKFKNNK